MTLVRSWALGHQVIFVVALLQAFLTSWLAVSAVNVSTSQLTYLGEVRSAIDLDDAVLTSWVSTNECEAWLGVTCNENGNVTRIVLSDTETALANGEVVPAALTSDMSFNLYGSLSPSVGKLTSLRHLVISKTEIVGRIPAALGALRELQTLNLSMNLLSGNLPDSLGSLSALRVLDLRLNVEYEETFGIGLGEVKGALNGSLPASLGNLKDLVTMDLSQCQFSGTVPSAFKNLTNLKQLILRNNKQLTGNLSEFIGNFSNLVYADLAFNVFKGSIPSLVGSFSRLEHLDLSENFLEGDIPESLGNVTSLQYLDLGTNFLTSIPTSIGNLKELQYLVLRNNVLEGEIPQSLGNLTNLTRLDLSVNGFLGAFPNFASLTKLQYLDLSYNFLSGNTTGGIPSYLGNFTKLDSLFLDFNNFGGSIPLSLTELPLLTWSCQRCGLEGSLPEEMGNMTTLVELYLSENNLTGPIPTTIGNLGNLATLDLSSNRLSGSIPDAIVNCVSLTDLWLFNNSLSGSIPAGIDQLANLAILYLQSNSLTGIIPPALGSLFYLSALDLSSNNLEGPIPRAIGNLGGDGGVLEQLSLSNNRLEGALPYTLGNLTLLKTLQVRNCSLTGVLPPQLKDLQNLEVLDLSYNQFTGFLPGSFFTNFTLLTELSMSTTAIYGPIPTLAALTGLTKMDLSFSQFYGDLPSTFPASLINIDLSNNFLTGSASSLTNVTSLQTLFADNNELSGGVPVLSGAADLSVVSLSNNRLNGSVPSFFLNATEASLDLSGNPVCDISNATSVHASVCSKLPLPTSYAAPPVCRNSSCLGDNVPSPFLFNRLQQCACAAPTTFVLALFPTPLTVFTNSTARQMQIFFARQLSMSRTQIMITSASSPAGRGFLVTLQFFSRGAAALPLANVSRILVLLNRDVPYPGLPLNRMGYARLVAYEVSDLQLPPPPPPPGGGVPAVVSSDDGGLEGWVIAVIVVAIAAVVLILIVIAIVFYLKEQKQRKALLQTSFAIRVQEHFVKAIPIAEIRAATNDFSEENMIGSGGYGTVYKGVTQNGDVWAVKRAKTISLKGLEDFQNEVDIISRMSHTNIIRLLGYCDERNEQILIYEFMQNGTLKDRLNQEDEGVDTFPLEQRVDAAIGAAEGLRYLHNFANPTIIHRDVKSENILFDAQNQAKVGDFGLLKDNLETTSEGLRTKVAGTPGYIDPEYYTNFAVTTKSDVYSFGVVLLELITGKPALIRDEKFQPGDSNYMTALTNWAQLFRTNVQGMVDPRLSSNHNKDAMDMFANLAYMCIERYSKARPDMDEVCRYLAEIRDVLKGNRSLRDTDSTRSSSFILGLGSETSSTSNVISLNNSATISMQSYSYGDSLTPMSTIMGGR